MARERARPKTEGQGRYWQALESATVTFCTGPAGTGKTWLAALRGVELLREGRIDRLVLSRPVVTCGKGLGFLKGDLEEKFGPFVRPLVEAVEDHAGKNEMERWLRDGRLEAWPLDFMRGSSFRRSLVILDEAQNATFEQLLLFLTRVGQESALVINGDTAQTDVAGGALRRVIGRLRRRPHPEVAFVRLDDSDIVRHPLVRFFDEALSACPACGRGHGDAE